MLPRFAWTSERICDVLGISTEGSDPRVYTGVSTDSRSMRPGELFVGLSGENFDGADFVAAAADAGAAGALVERQPRDVPEGFELFLVRDALEGLGKLAAARRRALSPTVVAITGTSGKTTTRELTTAVLGAAAYGSPGNYNNLVGLPLSILQAPEQVGIWVLEVASNQPGEVERLGRVAAPDYAIITSVSEGHLEGFRDLAGVLQEKLGLVSTLGTDGRALLADQPAELAGRARATCSNVRTVGLSSEADEHPVDWTLSSEGISWKWRGTDFRMPGYGTHLIVDALFAVVTAADLEVEPHVAAERLAVAKLPAMRGEVRRVGGLKLFVDCYNANPASFAAAIEALSGLAGKGRRAVLVGTMLELGAKTAGLHEQVAQQIIDSGIELVAATGEFRPAFERLSSKRDERLILASDLELAYQGLATRLRGDECVLIKASRGMKFERAITWFERDFGGKRRNIQEMEG